MHAIEIQKFVTITFINDRKLPRLPIGAKQNEWQMEKLCGYL